ncbi:MAG: LytTR family DNA-binding domain-containing protein, partial [Oscillospiraceae bacterium]|nr:LytTR family DNA-binding domain-containing protein [Oscillospiraceae bacterium]
MIRIAVVEDERGVRRMLTDYIARFASENGINPHVSEFSDGDEILQDYKAEYDVIFLDIQMKRLDGMEAARRIREIDEDVILIFVTNMANYAIRGYSVDAMDFVVKPVTYFAFSEQLKKAAGYLEKRKTHHVFIHTNDGKVRLNTNRIYYIESFNHRLILHTQSGDYTTGETMNAMEKMLAPHNFYRCNNCYLINFA